MITAAVSLSLWAVAKSNPVARQATQSHGALDHATKVSRAAEAPTSVRSQMAGERRPGRRHRYAADSRSLRKPSPLALGWIVVIAAVALGWSIVGPGTATLASTKNSPFPMAGTVLPRFAPVSMGTKWTMTQTEAVTIAQEFDVIAAQASVFPNTSRR